MSEIDLKLIKRQVEYYFNDANYSKDKFMNEIAMRYNGYIPLETLLTFKKLRSLKATPELVKEAVKESKIVKVDEDKIMKIITEEYLYYKSNGEAFIRTLLIKGFPINYTLDEISNVLTDPIPQRVSMLRDHDKQFSGSCYVEYGSLEEAESVLNKEITIEVIKESIETEEENTKKSKSTELIKLDISKKPKKDKVMNFKQKKQELAVKRIKKDFEGKIYKIENLGEKSILEVKKLVDGVAFVDLENKVLRMKYINDFDEKEFSDIKLIKLSPDECKEYFDKLDIKPKVRKGKKSFK
ncbi:LAB [Hepatospora eriocheir]|uniref:LAB n=1 Tax=Hepatospora eriocheir TaxID=1081669 RepID=A0A1X0QI03_9MICR|nr:LAB [Hepatospora eriocheir]